MEGSLRIELISLDAEPALAVAGEIDLASAPLVVRACRELASGTDHLRLDFTDVTFFDSSGVKALLTARAADGVRAISIANAPEHVIAVLRICGLSELLEATPDRNRAGKAGSRTR